MKSFLKNFFQSGALVSLGQGRVLLGFGKAKWMHEPEDLKKPAFYFPDFFLKSSYPWVQFDVAFETTVDALVEELNGWDSASCEGSFAPPQNDPFLEGFADLQKRFKEGTLQKAVPYLIYSAAEKMNPLKLAGLLVSLLRAAKSTQAFLYGFWNEELGMLGASPEVLFRLKERDRPLLETVALAGTLGDHPSVEAFLQDPKEIHEHGLVTEGIRQALEPFGKIHLGTMRAQECGKLTHLMTPIEVELRQHQSVDELVAALHPTPALGGFPKQEAWRWLEEYAKRIPRGRYGAPAGVLRAGGREMSCYVAIRGMQWNTNGFHIGAGCGVVKASRAENELAEIERKMSAICHLMGIEYALV